MITQARLKEILYYNPETGIFTRHSGAPCGTKAKAGYIAIGINWKRYYAHRLAWLYVYGEWPVELIDHKNMIKDDNRIDNLRVADKSKNGANSRGIRLDKPKNVFIQDNKYRVRIQFRSKNIHGGYFDREEDAIKAAEELQKKYFGEFSRAA